MSDTPCPACGSQLRQVGTGMGCDACGLYMSNGPVTEAGMAEARQWRTHSTEGGAGVPGASGWYRERLTKMTMPPNPLLPDIPMVKKGDRVGFKGLTGPLYVGVVEDVEIDRANGDVLITLEDDVTELED
jgi:hypothetical protein